MYVCVCVCVCVCVYTYIDVYAPHLLGKAVGVRQHSASALNTQHQHGAERARKRRCHHQKERHPQQRARDQAEDAAGGRDKEADEAPQGRQPGAKTKTTQRSKRKAGARRWGRLARSRAAGGRSAQPPPRPAQEILRRVRSNQHACVCVCVCVCVRACVRVSAHVRMYQWGNTYGEGRDLLRHARTHLYICMHTRILYIWVCVYVCNYTRVCASVYLHALICTHTRILYISLHICMHTRVGAHMQHRIHRNTP